MQKTKMIICIEDDIVSISGNKFSNSSNFGNVEAAKIVNKIIDFNTFVSTIKAVEQKISSPIFSDKVCMYSSNNRNIELCLFSPVQKIDLSARINNNTVKVFKDALLPSYIMKVNFNSSYMMTGSSIRMLNNILSINDLTDTDMRNSYFMPFPNIYSHNTICWGHTLDTLGINIKNVGLLIDIFNNSIFNNDLFSSPLMHIERVFSDIHTLDDYFTYLTTINTFPSSLMMDQM